MAKQKTMPNQVQARATCPRRRRIPLMAKLAVALAVVASLAGGTYAYALAYFTCDYSWLTSLDESTYHVNSAGQLQALSNIVDGSWELDPVAYGGTGDEAADRLALPEDVQDALMGEGGYDFTGKTVQMTGVTDFLGLGTIKPIGTADCAFNGTFDGNGRDVGALRITNVPENANDPDEPVSPLQYVGLFGHVGPQGSVCNLTLGRGCQVDIHATATSDHIAYVGSLVGWCEGSISNCESRATVNVEWDDGNGGDERCSLGNYANAYVVEGVGGIAGFCDGDVTGTTFKGSVNVLTPANATWVAEADSNETDVVRYVGGVVGRSGGNPAQAGVAGTAYGNLADCTNAGDVTVSTTGAGGQDRFGETVDSKSQYVGGIAGYAIGNISACANTGDIVASSHAWDDNLSYAANWKAYDDANGGGDATGGIVGGFRSMGYSNVWSVLPDKAAYYQAFRNNGDNVDRGIAGAAEAGTPHVVQIARCTNLGLIESCNNVGGIAGSTGTYTRVDRCVNGDAKKYAQDDSVGRVVSVRWNKPNTGGLVGRCYGDVAYSRNHGEVNTTKVGYYVGGLVGDLYFYRTQNGGGAKYLTPEVYACYNTGQVYCSKVLRRGTLLGGNGGYIHDCLFLFGTAGASEDEGIMAVGEEKAVDSPMRANIGVAYASDAQALEHGDGSFSLKSPHAVAWLNNSAMLADDEGVTGWESGIYYMATPAANRGYPVLVEEGRKSTTAMNLADLNPTITLVEDAAFTSAYNPTPKLKVVYTVSGKEVELVENADYYVVPDSAALDENGVCKGTTDGQRIYTAQVRGIGNYESEPIGEVKYAIGKGDFAECTISAVADTYSGKAQQAMRISVVDPAGGVVNPDDYTLVVNDGNPCVDPGEYSVIATASQSSNYVGHCSGTYGIQKIDIARDCDVIGVVYDEPLHGGVNDDSQGIPANPRVWFYADDTYKLYEVIPEVNSSTGELVTYTSSDIDMLRSQGAIPSEAPDEVARGYIGYPKVQGFRVYKEEDSDRWLTRADAKCDADSDGRPDEFGMKVEYTAGELRPEVIGVNWLQGKLALDDGDGGAYDAWRVIYGGGAGGSTAGTTDGSVTTGSKNVEASATGAITIATTRSPGLVYYTTNYDVLNFDIEPAEISPSDVQVTLDESKRVFKVGAKPEPVATVLFKGNVVDSKNYKLELDRVTDASGAEVSRTSEFEEGDTLQYKVTFKASGSLLCEESVRTGADGQALTCVVVNEKIPLVSSRFDVQFNEGWELVDGIWTKQFTLADGIDAPIVTVTDRQQMDDQGNPRTLVEGIDYAIDRSDYKAPGCNDTPGGARPNVSIVGLNRYSGSMMVYYRIAKGLLTQEMLDSMAAGGWTDSTGEAAATVCGLAGRSWLCPQGTEGEWLSSFGTYPHFAYRPCGYSAENLSNSLGVAFRSKSGWGAGADGNLFNVVRIAKDGADVTAEGAREVGVYQLTLKASTNNWGSYNRVNTSSGSMYFDVDQSAEIVVNMRIVPNDITIAQMGTYREGNDTIDVGSAVTGFILSLHEYDESKQYHERNYAYTNDEYAYTGNPMKPRYWLRDTCNYARNQRLEVTDGDTRRYETDEEVLARVAPHTYGYDDYDVLVEGFEKAGGLPVDVGTGYQVVALTGTETGHLVGSYLPKNASNLENNVFSIVAADVSDSSVVGIRVGAGADDSASAQVGYAVGYLGANGARPEIHFFVDADGVDGDGDGSVFDLDEECSYVEGEDYEVEYLNNEDVSTDESAAAIARIWVKDTRHLTAKRAGMQDAMSGRWFFDVPFTVTGRAVTLNEKADVAWTGLSSKLVLADAEAGTISQPTASPTYKQVIGDAASDDVAVPSDAYQLVCGTLNDKGEFVEKAGGWRVGDDVSIGVKTGSFARFIVDTEISCVIGEATVVAASQDNDFAADGSSLQVLLSQDRYVYGAVGREPAVTVTGAGETLRQDTDYSVEYRSNVDAGEAQVIVTGRGAFVGKRVVPFTIDKLDLSDCVVTGPDKGYTGEQVVLETDEVSVTSGGVSVGHAEGGWRIAESTWGENVKAGNGSFVVEATEDGNMTGSTSGSFTIVGRALSDCVVAPTQPSKSLADGERMLQVSDFADGDVRITDPLANRNLVMGEDYVIAGIANADGFENSQTDMGGIIYRGVATLTVRGVGNYSGAVQIDIPIAAKSLANATVAFAETTDGVFTYSGVEIRPPVTVSLQGSKLEEGADYSLVYSGNVDAGTATIRVQGMGMYRGSQSAQVLTFEIKPATVSESGASLELSSDELQYTGAPVQPATQLVLRGEKVPRTNCELAYYRIEGGGQDTGSANGVDEGIGNLVALDAAPTEPGLYRVTATAVKGSLLGSASADFSIVACDLSACTLSLSEAPFAFGDTVAPSVKIATPDKVEIDPTVAECAVSYELAGGEAGWSVGSSALAIVRASGESIYFKGKISTAYKVGRIVLKRSDIAFADNTKLEYTGKQVLPSLTISVNGRRLTQGNDYEISPLSSDLVSPGTKVLEVTTPATSVYESNGIQVVYEVEAKKEEPPASSSSSSAAGSGSSSSSSSSSEASLAPVGLDGKTNAPKDSGSKSASSSWSASKVAIADAGVTGVKNFVYSGKALAQAPIVKSGATTLKKDVDYVLSYCDAKGKSVNASAVKAVGTYKLVVTGKGAYTGTVTKPFKIAKAKNTLVAKAKAKTISVKHAKLKKKAQTVNKSKAFSISKAKGAVTFKKTSGNKKISVNAKTGAVVLKRELKKGTYKVVVKVKAKGTVNYKAATKTVVLKFKVK